MADNLNQNHIVVGDRYSTTQKYKYPKSVQIEFKIKEQNRATHGNRILNQLETIRDQFQINQDIDLPQNIIRDDAIYVEFISEWGYELKYDQLNDSKGKYQLLSIKRENNIADDEKYRYRVVVMMTKGGISHFIKKTGLFLTENSKYKGVVTNKPKANDLIANIESIQLATLKAFWSDGPEIPFPNDNELVWWEIWFRKSDNAENEDKVLKNITAIGAQVGQSKLIFPEHFVRLVRGSAIQLSQSLMLLDNLAELRKPQEMANFILHENISDSDKQEWLKDLIERTENHVDSNSVLICLLDSGVNNLHPLINPVLPDARLYTYNESWGKFDGEPNGGHGTGMAGLAIYGDMVDALATRNKIHIYHGLESFKLYNPNISIDPDLYGVVYEIACSIPVIDSPYNPRVYCLSVTNKDFIANGRPSSSSASIDKIAFGQAIDDAQLILISGGNVTIYRSNEYPDKNYNESIHDPGQAYNAITVGSYTRKCKIFNGLTALSPYGGMSPSNSTSFFWENQWPNKPDIVMEGGNLADDGGDAVSHPLLSPLSIDKEYSKYTFIPFGDTSASVALASKMAAELRTKYPDYWPETIRALMIHSAEWTDAMLGINRNIGSWSKADKRTLLRSVGYGVPIISKALYSGSNSLTLIAQRKIQPYRKENSQVKFNDYHLYTLPWPTNVLRDAIGDKDVILKITLSYYIEPNPGNRQYANNFNYHSHELDFNLIKRSESLNEFKSRISADSSDENENDSDDIDKTTEEWTLRSRVRSKGSIKKDFIITSGAELSERNILAVYPKNGWYRTRKKLGKVESEVRYSLIVSIETNETEIDLYTPVFTEIVAAIPIQTNL